MKASEYRKRRPTVEMTGDITLPSGAVFKMRRPPFDIWMAAGKIPQAFLRAMLEAQQGGNNAVASFTTTETLEGLTFLTEAVIYASVEPKLAIESDDPDVLLLSDLDGDDFKFLTSWIQSGSPGVPVRTLSGGEVQPEKLTRFRQKRPGGSVASNSDHGNEVRSEAEQSLRAG